MSLVYEAKKKKEQFQDDDDGGSDEIQSEIEKDKQHQMHHQIGSSTGNLNFTLHPKQHSSDNQLIELGKHVENSDLHSFNMKNNYHTNATICNPQTTSGACNTKNNSYKIKINVNVRTIPSTNESDNVCDDNDGNIEHNDNNVNDNINSSSLSSSSNFEINNKYTNNSQSNSNTRKFSTKKPKLGKLGTKSVGLKRVSFGSSKGSMVETLVFETPTPLSEHTEPNFGFSSCDPDTSLSDIQKTNDDSGIDIQEETSHSVVRVSIYQSNQPQQISHPSSYYLTNPENISNSSLDNIYYNYDTIMAATTASSIAAYDRQQSTDSGWENPFRPGGDLSREADEIVKMISGGKPITPIDDHIVKNDNNMEKINNGIITEATESVTKRNVCQSQSTQNGAANKTSTSFNGITKSTENNNKLYSSTAQISKQVVPGPTSASHVLIDEKKNKRKGCCIIQ